MASSGSCFRRSPAARRSLLLGALPVALLASAVGMAQDGVQWTASLAEAQRLALQQRRLVLVHFWSESCGPCQRLEKNVFPREDFARVLHANYIPVKLKAEETRDLLQQYRITRFPTDVYLTAQGQEVYRCVSPQDPQQYAHLLDQVAAHVHAGRQPEAPPVAARQEATLAKSVPSPPREARPAAVASITDTGRQPAQAAIENPFFQPSPPSPAPVQQAYASQRLAPERAPGVPAPGPGGQDAAPPPRTASDSPQVTAGLSRWSSAVVSPPPPAPPQAAAAAAPPPANAPPSAPPPRVPATAAALSTAPPSVTGPSPLAATTPTPAAAPRPESPPPAASAPPAPPGLDGYCPVTLVEAVRWQKGDARWSAAHEGRTYWLAGPQQQQLFLADPARYCPVLAGHDVVRFREQGTFVPGEREYGVAYRERYYLFADESALERFARAPQDYALTPLAASPPSRP